MRAGQLDHDRVAQAGQRVWQDLAQQAQQEAQMQYVSKHTAGMDVAPGGAGIHVAGQLQHDRITQAGQRVWHKLAQQAQQDA